METEERKWGLCLRLDASSDGSFKIILSDAERAGPNWRERVFFTEFEVSKHDLFEGELPEALLNSVGLAVLLRLAALEQVRHGGT